MPSSFFSILLALAATVAAGVLSTLRPSGLTRLFSPLPLAAHTPAPAAEVEASVAAVAGDPGALIDLCLGMDPGRLRQAAAEALGLPIAALNADLAAGHTLAQVAEAHGLSRADLEAALLAAAQADLRERLDSLAADGDLTPEQVEALLALQAARGVAHLLDHQSFFAMPGVPDLLPDDGPLFAEPFDGRPPLDSAQGTQSVGRVLFRFHFQTSGAGPFTFEVSTNSLEVRAALARALGLSPDELAARLAGGESLGALARAQGLDQAELTVAWRAAALAQAEVDLAAAVAEGRLTQTQADELRSQIARALDGTILHVKALSALSGGPPPFFMLGEPEPWFFERLAPASTRPPD